MFSSNSLKNLSNFSICDDIDDNETRIVIVKNKINIINYIDIGHFDSNKIVVKLKKNNISVNGKNLVVSKLINDEILITGEFDNIEFR